MNNETNVNVQYVSPLKKILMTIGELPSSYLETMTYYEMVVWFTEFLRNQVIPTVNNNAEAVQELQTLYEELKNYVNESIEDVNENVTNLHDYVENYFENLDVQTEINNKLDSLVEDGTISTLLTPIVGNQINNLASDIHAEVNEISSRVSNVDLNKYRKKYYNPYDIAEKPNNYLTSPFFDKFQILTNGEGDYKVDYNINEFKNSGGTTYYISPNGNNSNDGLSEGNAKKSLPNVMLSASAGDTIIYLDGIYNKDDGLGTITKSINLIAKNKGKVWLKTGSNLSYTLAEGFTKTYHATRSGIYNVIDISKKEDGVYNFLTLVQSIQDVEDTENSYFISGSDLYVHLFNDVVPSDETLDVGLILGVASLTFNNFTEDTKIYIEGLNFMDSNVGGILCNNTTNYNVYLTVRDCNLYNTNSSSYTYDAISNKGSFSFCENVGIFNGGKDGFNYHAGTNKQAIGVELNCVANDFGKGKTSQSQLSNNATTAHEYSETIRINGNYSYCNGGVVADVNNTKGIMYGCVIFDSYGQSYDVLAQTDSTIYMYDCYTKGSRANTNLLTSGENAHIYYKNTEFDTKTGNVTELS